MTETQELEPGVVIAAVRVATDPKDNDYKKARIFLKRRLPGIWRFCGDNRLTPGDRSTLAALLTELARCSWMFGIKPPTLPNPADPWSVIGWPLQLGRYQERLERRSAKIETLKQVCYFIGSVVALLGVAAWMDHLNGYDNGNTGIIFWFLATVVCGVGWLIKHDKAARLQRDYDALQQHYNQLAEKQAT